MWVMILFVMGAMTSIPGFTSKEACQMAAYNFVAAAISTPKEAIKASCMQVL